MNRIIAIKLITTMGMFWKTDRRTITVVWKYSFILNRSFDRLSDWINMMLGYSATGHYCIHQYAF